MPTGADTRNPLGLMKAVRESRKRNADAFAQLDRFEAQLAKTAKLAEAFDDAVMREDADAVVKLLKKGGLKGKITIEKMDADRMVLIEICFTGSTRTCYRWFYDW